MTSGQTAAHEYSIFWQCSPRYEGAGENRRLTDIDVELMGSHTSDPRHLDPDCSVCDDVRSLLLGIAHAMVDETAVHSSGCFCDIDPHASEVLRLPGSGDRSFVSVSVDVFLGNGNGQAPETDVMNAIRSFMVKSGIHQH